MNAAQKREVETDAYVTATLNEHEWSLTGWPAAVILWTPVLAALFCFVVGVVTVAGWVLR